MSPAPSHTELVRDIIESALLFKKGQEKVSSEEKKTEEGGIT